jgi:anaerobic selenocysteine-containing dehydrogenase
MNSDKLTHILGVSRRRFLRGASLAAGAGALLGAGLAATSAAADSKFSQTMAKYQPTPKGASRCDNCSQFKGPSSCNVVAGAVSPAGWCQLYAVKS